MSGPWGKNTLAGVPDDLPTLQASLRALRMARDSGVLMVRHGDTTTQFRSLAEIGQIIAELERKTAILLNGRQSTRRPRYIYQTTKGL